MSPSALSEDIWAIILSYVPLTDRMCSCILVSKLLNRAAAAATNQTMELSLHPKYSPAFLEWIQGHGRQLETLKLTSANPVGFSAGFGFKITELPCHNLRVLELSGCLVQLGPPDLRLLGKWRKADGLSAASVGAALSAQASTGALTCCSKLTRLCIHNSLLTDGKQCLEALAGTVLCPCTPDFFVIEVSLAGHEQPVKSNHPGSQLYVAMPAPVCYVMPGASADASSEFILRTCIHQPSLY